MIHRLALLLLLCAPVLAPAQDFYLGAGLGHAEMVIEDDMVSTLDFNGDHLAPRLFAGYRPLPFLALEASYVDYGSPEERVNGTVRVRPEGNFDGRVHQVGNFEAFGISVLGLWPLGSVDLFAKAGIARWEGSLRATRAVDVIMINDDGSVVVTEREESIAVSQRSFDPLVSLGAQFRYRQLAVRGELEALFLRFDDDDNGRNDGRDFAGSLSVSFIWSF